MFELLATDLTVGLVIATVFYVIGVIYDLSRSYFSSGTTVPAV